MRLLIVTNHFYPEDFRVNDIAFWLAERGHQVTVVTGAPNYPEGRIFDGYGLWQRSDEVVRGVRVVRMPLIARGRGRGPELAMNYASHGLSACALAPLRLRDDYEAIFVFDTSPVTVALSAILMKRLRRVPLIMWMLDLWPESLTAAGGVESRLVLWAVRRLVRFVYSQCDQLLVSSRGFEKQVRDTGGYRGEVTYFPNWVEDVYSKCISHSHDSEPGDPFVILFAGNVGEAQSFPTILDAVVKAKAQARPDDRPLLWRIVGDGRALPWVRAQVHARSLQADVELLGRFPPAAMPDHYAKADALLLTLAKNPVFALTAPGKLQSYLIAGRPILGALDGEGARIVEDAKAGFVVAAENSSALAKAGRELARMHPRARSAMGERGHEYCSLHFARQELLEGLEQFMEDVVASRAGRMSPRSASSHPETRQ